MLSQNKTPLPVQAAGFTISSTGGKKHNSESILASFSFHSIEKLVIKITAPLPIE